MRGLLVLKDWEKKVKNLFFVAAAFLLLTIPCYAEIIIVDDDWPYDFNNIQAAIDYSSNGDFIFVFPGTYKGPANRDISFFGKAITVRSVIPTDPYIVAETVIDCNGLGRGFNFTRGEDANSILAGFTITRSSSNGAIYCGHSSPTITYCIISNNIISGIYCIGSNSVITNCTITGNTGSGVHCEYSAPMIADCIISSNTGYGRTSYGGGISVLNGLCLIYDSVISGNISKGGPGGGIYYIGNSQITATDCTITGNLAKYDGGGIFINSPGISKVTNCTISSNSAERNGGGIYLANSSSSIFITNSIIWGNTDSIGAGQSAQIYSGKPNVWFSCIQDDNSNDSNIPFSEEQFNIDDDPCFADPGFWDVNVWHNGDYHLLPTSPCIETGNPLFTYHAGDVDIDGQPRVMGRCVDMGADEFELSVIVVTKPKGGEVWTAGSTHEIKWTSSNITGDVDIYFSIDNGAYWVMIDKVPDTGSFLWHLPDAIDSNRCLISVEPNVFVSNLIWTQSGLFTIHPDSPGPPVVSKWKSLGGDFDRSGLSQNSGPELGCVKWQFHTNGLVSASPTIGAAGKVYLSCEDGNLYALDANGLLLWSYDTNSPLLSAPSIGPDGSVFVGAQNGKLYAIDVNGNLRWTHSTKGPIYSSPAVSPDGNVYVCSQDGALYALGRDGSGLWTFETASSCIVAGAIFASPAIGPDGTLFISGLYDPNLYALDPNTGNVKWTCIFLDPCEPENSKLRPFASPVIAPDGTIYQALLFNPIRFINEHLNDTSFWYDSRLYAIDSNNGNILWSTNMTETAKQWEHKNPHPPEPNYWFKQYYFNLYHSHFPYQYPYTYTDLFSDILRYYRVSNSSWSEPALAPDGTIYISFDDQYLRAVGPNGSIKWVTSLGWSGGFKLTVGSNGLIYAASNDGWLYVVDPDGREIARLESGDWLGYPVIYDDGTIIIADSNNTVSAVSSDGCEGLPAALHRLEDLNNDWSVNLIDFAKVAEVWLECTDTSYDPLTSIAYCNYNGDEAFLAGDINRDQYVNTADLADLANRWLIEE
jgi:parallel beta-helix repeat protein